MKQYIAGGIAAFMTIFGVSAHAFDYSLSKNYSEGKLTITGESEINDNLSVFVMKLVFS